MSHVKQFTVGSVSYNAARASAVQQDRILSLLAQPVIERAMVSAKQGFDLDAKVIMPMFMAMNTTIKREISDILMQQVIINGTERRVTIDDFDGNMVGYNQLLAELLMWNLSDFFGWLPSVVADVRAETKGAKQP